MTTINGIDWEIKLVSPNHPLLLTEHGNYALGVCDRDLRKIVINEEISSHYLWKVLCHEIVHAAMFSYGVNLDYDQEETIADIIATHGKEIVQLTNRIFKYLIK